jgi:hypothetical protein
MSKQITYYQINYNWFLVVIVGMLGYKLNNDSVGWGIVDGIFYPIAIIKWIACEELTLTLIKNTFPFFLR